MSSPTTSGTRRLKELATQARVFAVAQELPLQPSSRLTTDVSDADRAQAISLLAERRRQRPDFKDAGDGVKGLFRRATTKEKLNNPENWTFSANELDEGLEAVVGYAEPGLVTALLDLGSNVNIVRAPDLTKKDKRVSIVNVSRRSTVIAKAAASPQRHSTLRVLTNHGADQAVLDDGLQAALAAGSWECVQELLARGANINKHARYFDKAMSKEDIATIRLFLRAPRALEVDKLSGALVHSVKRKSLPILSLLLAHGADPNHQDALAFHTALENHNFELAIALASLSRVPIRSSSLSKHTLAHLTDIRNRELLKRFTELLLCCGMFVTTPGLPDMLVKATKDTWIEMATLLTSHGVSPDYNGAESLMFAVRNSNYRLTDVLLSCHISPCNASQAMQLIPNGPSSSNRTGLIRKLISKGATGASLGEMLCLAVDQRDLKLISLLVQNSAPVDTNNGQLLCTAMSAGHFDTFGILLDGHPSVETLNGAFGAIRQLLPQTDWLKATRLLLRAGANGKNVHLALIQSITDDFDCTEIIEEILRHGGDVNYDSGQCLKLAVESGQLDVLKLLCAAKPYSTVVSNTLPLTLFSNGRKRRTSVQMIRLLLGSGAAGKPLSQTLTIAIGGGTKNVDIIRTLVQAGADVNLDSALPLVKALDDMNILELLLDSRTLKQSSVDQVLTTALQSNNFHKDQSRIILQKCRDVTIINKLLLSEIESKPMRAEVIDLLLEFGAEVNYQDGIVLVSAIQKKDVKLTRRLLQKGPNSQCRSRAFQSALHLRNEDDKFELMVCILDAGVTEGQIKAALVSESTNALSSQDLKIVNLLIERGANSDYNDGQALISSVSAQDINLTKVLLDTKPSRLILSTAFETLIGDSSRMTSRRTYQLAALLVQAGISERVRDIALCNILHPDHSQWNPYARKIVDLLLYHGANVNNEDGVCFEYAAKKNDAGLLNALMDHDPDFGIIFPRLITLGLGTDALLRVLDLCFKHKSAPPNMNIHGQSGVSLLFTTMENYRQSAKVVKFLLDHGCSANAVISYALDPGLGVENITALLWALAPRNRISNDVILALLNAGASATFQSNRSGLTPITLATREGREDIVTDLVQRNVDVSTIDAYDRTPLFYACMNSSTRIAQILHSKKVGRDDGSLHEAAKNLNIEIVILLINRGHKPDAPSVHHGGRSTLGEVCLNAQNISSVEERNKLRGLIKLLLEENSNPKIHDRQKSTIFLALDNATDPHSMTKTLLDTEIYTTLNDMEHVYYDVDSGLCYSPLSYVEHEMYAKSPNQKAQLVRLLQGKRCRQSFYSKAGKQPLNAIGMPDAAQQEFDREVEHRSRLRREQEAEDQRLQQLQKSHSMSILRHRESVTDALQLQGEKHSAAVQQYADLHNQKLAAARAEYRNQAQLEQSSHTIRLQRLDETEQRQLSADGTRHLNRIDQEKDLALIRRNIKDEDNAADLEHGGKLILQQDAALRSRIDLEHQAMLNRESVNNRMLKSQMDILREQARIQSNIAANEKSQKAIGWDELD